MTNQLAPSQVQHFTDNQGNPLAFGFVFTYVAGTATPQATYPSSSSGTPNPNPVQLNARGEAAIWLDPALTYKINLTDNRGNQVPGWPVDNIPGGFNVTQQIIGALLYPRTAAETAAGVTPVNFFYPAGSIERYYSGSGDARTAIQAALNTNGEVYSFFGWQTQFPASDYLLIPPGVTLRDCAIVGTANVTPYAPWGANHQGQSVLCNGDGCQVLHVWIAGANFVFGGIGTNNTFQRACIRDCTIENCSSSQAILAQGLYDTIEGNTLRYAAHGIQLGGVGTVVTGNNIRVVGGAGIWSPNFSGGAGGYVITGNRVFDCGDVGLDLEGNVNCEITGNVAGACRNGELTWFAGTNVGHNCLFADNTVLRGTTYTTWSGDVECLNMPITAITQSATAVVTTSGAAALQPFFVGEQILFAGVVGMTQINGLVGTISAVGGGVGAWTATTNINSSAFTAYSNAGTVSPATNSLDGGIAIASILSGQSGIVFSGNLIRAIGRPGLTTAQLESSVTPFDCGITIKGGAIFSDTNLLNINTAPGIAIEGVTFIGLSGAESSNNLIKNVYGARIERCTFDYATAPSGSNYGLDYFTDGTVSAGGPPTIAGNFFYGCSDNALNHRPVSVPAVVSGNHFTLNRSAATPFTAKGGINVATTMPLYTGQKLYVTTSAASLDLSTLTALNGVNQRVTLDARMILVNGGAMKNTYDFAYSNVTLKSRDGTGSASGILASTTDFASFATSVITITGGDTAYIEMDLTSWQ